ncbi:hypothetical protein B4113_0117 [Geobacillus sp. B4113_201601]|nr:hypothetical protein B4113_0117 [Geobacillus sp. B4113_201601]
MSSRCSRRTGRSRKDHSVVEFIYDAEKQDIPIDVIKKALCRLRGILFVS